MKTRFLVNIYHEGKIVNERVCDDWFIDGNNSGDLALFIKVDGRTIKILNLVSDWDYEVKRILW